MKHQKLDGIIFAQMIREGAKRLSDHVKTVDALNVFPVPDGDTGTNMNLSFTSGVNEMNNVHSENISDVAKALSRGLLMGARGNSGVILSQLFRGFAKYVEGHAEINARQFAHAVRNGVETAYKAVMKPVEGTILTVSKDAAQQAEKWARQSDDITEVMSKMLEEARASLQRTPDLLPILKQVGVVDSGGQGLVYVYEGFLHALRGEVVQPDRPTTTENEPQISKNKEEHVREEVAEMMAAGVLSVEDIQYGYCTEFIIRLDTDRVALFDEQHFRLQMNRFGDSLLVISDDELVKVHIHAEELYKVMELAQSYGELMNIKIENMREQFLALQETKNQTKEPAEQETQEGQAIKVQETKEYGMISVAIGEGTKKMLMELGVDVVIQGGQTMNPSTEDFVKAIRSIAARQVIILPSNSNIILAAEQSAELVDVPVTVIPTKNLPQTIASLLQFNPTLPLEQNRTMMLTAKDMVKAGQVTYAVRDTEFNGVTINKGDFMGILNGNIVCSAAQVDDAVKQLIDEMIDEDSEILTLIYGEDVTKADIEELVPYLEERYKHIEFEVHHGGQPLYHYIIAVE